MRSKSGRETETWHIVAARLFWPVGEETNLT